MKENFKKLSLQKLIFNFKILLFFIFWGIFLYKTLKNKKHPVLAHWVFQKPIQLVQMDYSFGKVH